MRHDLILRALRLPLLAALCMCTALVAVTAHGLPSREPHGAFLRRDLSGMRQISTASRFSATSLSLTARADGLAAHLRPTASIGQPDGSIDWNALAVTAAECVVRSGGMLGRYLVALREPPAEERAPDISHSPPAGVADKAAAPSAGADRNRAGRSETPVPPNATLPPAAPSAEVHVSNPAENGLPVAFLADEKVIQLAAGEGRSFAASPVTVRFDRGGRFGSATKTLTVGRYEFRLSTDGWDIVTDSP